MGKNVMYLQIVTFNILISGQCQLGLSKGHNSDTTTTKHSSCNDSQMILRVEVQKLQGFSWLESLAEIYENNKGPYAIYTFIFFDGMIGKANYIFTLIMLVYRYYISKGIGPTLIHLNLHMVNMQNYRKNLNVCLQFLHNE